MVTTFYPPYNFGGDGIFVERLVTALAKDGHDIHVVHDKDAFAFCSGRILESANQGQYKNVTIHTIGGAQADKLDLLARHQLGRPVGRHKELETLLNAGFDVIHFHNISLMGGPEILKYGSGLKLCTLHDHWFVCATHALWRFDREACGQRTCLACTVASKKPPQIWRYTDAVADAAKHVDAFIAPSEFAKRSHHANGFPAAIRVLPHFMPEEQVSALRAAKKLPSVGAAGELKLNAESQSERPYFLFVGRLEKLKGAQFLIEQFREYRQADLVIAGTGEYAKALEKQAAGLNHVRFTGPIGDDTLRNLYHGAIAVIVPSLCYETFGLVPLEAFAAGTPAIVHNLGALTEVVKGGGGITYEGPDELRAALERMRLEPQWRAKLSAEAADNLLSNYTEQRHLTKYYDMIAELNVPKSMQEVR
jgi:glycosyltransferase involved in cell wall biosynthesis